jgi:predicted hydrocarbon binding protein
MKKVEDLKNYGKPMSDVSISSENKKYSKKITRTVIAELRREVGIIGIIKLLLKSRKETNRGKALDWSSLKERGMTNQRFLNYLITQMATVKAMADIVGKDKASSILRRSFDNEVDITAPIYPPPEDFKACGDGFVAFSKYIKQKFTASHVNASELDIVEDSPRALVVNVKYCPHCEVAKKLGDPSLCYSMSCYWEEVYMSKALPELGALFKRTGTLSTGAPVCDFRFELVSKTDF